jgi:hypothetical protein
MLPGFRLPAVFELFDVCYKSFSLIFGGGSGAAFVTEDEEVLEFCSVGLSSRSWEFSLVLVLVPVFLDVVAPLFGVLSSALSVFGGAAFFDCQFTSSIDTNFFRRSRY